MEGYFSVILVGNFEYFGGNCGDNIRDFGGYNWVNVKDHAWGPFLLLCRVFKVLSGIILGVI